MATYELAQYSWNDREVISITFSDGTFIGILPLTFVRSGGVNTWRYVSEVIHELVETETQCELRNTEGLLVALDAEPRPGKYVLRRSGE